MRYFLHDCNVTIPDKSSRKSRRTLPPEKLFSTLYMPCISSCLSFSNTLTCSARKYIFVYPSRYISGRTWYCCRIATVVVNGPWQRVLSETRQPNLIIIIRKRFKNQLSISILNNEFWLSPASEFLMYHTCRISGFRHSHSFQNSTAPELLQHDILFIHSRKLLGVWSYASNEMWFWLFQSLNQLEQLALNVIII